MQADDETTAVQLSELLAKSGMQISLATVKRCRGTLGWIFHGTRYCQMIREPNKLRRLEFANQCLATKDDFDDVSSTRMSSKALFSQAKSKTKAQTTTKACFESPCMYGLE